MANPNRAMAYVAKRPFTCVEQTRDARNAYVYAEEYRKVNPAREVKVTFVKMGPRKGGWRECRVWVREPDMRVQA